ncbi:MAG TPA: MFS transporter [Planctomycetaceae bacterium]|jgi:AAHS family 4-hydroxybenzoate transporter-like MFS transporter|nr:MFS transporter [Planctomycetaceae bacterium]
MSRTEAGTTQDVFDVPAFINSRHVGAVQYGIIVLCGLMMLLDGFDTQAISYIAPRIAREWGLSRELLGPIFSSALTGLLVGYLVLSPLSDRFGHRRLIIISTVTFALLTLITVSATSVTQLIALRFVTGIALGAAIPSAVSLTTEYSPKRLRATFVLALYCGFSLGFVAAGGVAAWIIPLHGWRSLLWIGAIAPLTLAVFVFIFLPESIDFLVRTKAEPESIWRVVRSVDRALPNQGPHVFTTLVEEKRSAVGSLFQSDRTLGTLVLWLVFGLNLAEFYALQSWLPTILTNLGHSLNTVALATSLMEIGGIVAAFVIGPAMDRLGPYGSLATVYFAGVVFVALLGLAISAPSWVLLIAVFCAGFCISGGQKSVIALAAIFYPTPIRSTGVGWALGIGRVGGIGGPLLIGALLAYQLSAASLFYAAAGPMLLAGILVMLLGVKYKTP